MADEAYINRNAFGELELSSEPESPILHQPKYELRENPMKPGITEAYEIGTFSTTPAFELERDHLLGHLHATPVPRPQYSAAEYAAAERQVEARRREDERKAAREKQRRKAEPLIVGAQRTRSGSVDIDDLSDLGWVLGVQGILFPLFFVISVPWLMLRRSRRMAGKLAMGAGKEAMEIVGAVASVAGGSATLYALANQQAGPFIVSAFAGLVVVIIGFLRSDMPPA